MKNYSFTHVTAHINARP